MRKVAEIFYEGIAEDKKYEEIIENVYKVCFKEEELYDSSIYISVILSNEE